MFLALAPPPHWAEFGTQMRSKQFDNSSALLVSAVYFVASKPSHSKLWSMTPP